MLPHDLTTDDLKKRYVYNRITGEFRWAADFCGTKGDAKRKGDLAGRWRGDEYILTCKQHQLPGRRVAWWFVHGVWPSFKIGVLDGDPSNLRADNLAPVTEVTKQRYTRACAQCQCPFHSRHPLKYCSAKCRRAAVPEPPRNCTKCSAELSESEQHYRCCTACRQVADRNRRLAKKYGLTITAFDALLAAQDYCCAICGGSHDSGPVVDHDHATGAVRGILCSPCNTGLGHFCDDPQKLLKAAKYLSKSA